MIHGDPHQKKELILITQKINKIIEKILSTQKIPLNSIINEALKIHGIIHHQKNLKNSITIPKISKNQIIGIHHHLQKIPKDLIQNVMISDQIDQNPKKKVDMVVIGLNVVINHKNNLIMQILERNIKNWPYQRELLKLSMFPGFITLNIFMFKLHLVKLNLNE